MLQDILLTAPFWIVGIGGIVILLLDVFFGKDWPRGAFAGFLLVAGMLYCVPTLHNEELAHTAFSGIVYTDPFSVYTTFFILLSTLLVVLLTINRIQKEGIEAPGEFYALLLMSAAGGLLFSNARELISMFLGLEILSMSLYCLCGSAIAKRESSESALKYFLLGSFSSAFLLYGIALLYGVSGSLFIPTIAESIANNHSSILLLALGFMLVGFAFKIAVVPFHFWAPDVYQGAPLSVTAFMATTVKASACFAFIRFLTILFPSHIEDWSRFIWVLSVLTIIAGNLLALRQRNVKRMLAYSSIAHAGYLMAAFLVPGETNVGAASVLFYLGTYTAMTLGSFAVLSTLKIPHGSFSYDISSLYGLSKKHPVLSVALGLFMFTLAGLPPGLAGLLGKFFIFSSVVSGGYVGLSIIAMIGSTVSCYYYLRVVVATFFMPENTEDPVDEVSLLQQGVLLTCAVFCLCLGLFPSELYAFAQNVVLF